ncbi:MAG TPA: methyltransferase domain-containing protein [Bacteroidota bacterium]|nr:methyltransferase domain-containing protein [Bacteroidota bacterium]
MNAQEGESGHTLHAGLDLGMEHGAAFDTIVEELRDAFGRSGMTFTPGPGGRLVEGESVIGTVVSWEPGKRILFRWHQAPWQPDEVTELEIRFESTPGGTRIGLEHRGWGRLFGGDAEAAGWFAGAAIAPLMRAMAGDALGDWITDRRARKPGGAAALSVYRDPLYHYPGFRAILAELRLSREDFLLEVGCGGGVLLHQALESGCRAAAIDHSPEMVRLATGMNQAAVDAGRLEILEGSAEKLPFPDGRFTCATMSGVFGFIADPAGALREIRRVLRPGGRIMIMGTEPSMKGTPAAPEPMASRIHFYEDAEFELLGRRAGFTDARVVRRSLEQYARESGIPAEHMPLFAGPGMPFLIARRT